MLKSSFRESPRSIIPIPTAGTSLVVIVNSEKNYESPNKRLKYVEDQFLIWHMCYSSGHMT